MTKTVKFWPATALKEAAFAEAPLAITLGTDKHL
jgi:hypothetical protein